MVEPQSHAHKPGTPQDASQQPTGIGTVARTRSFAERMGGSLQILPHATRTAAVMPRGRRIEAVRHACGAVVEEVVAEEVVAEEVVAEEVGLSAKCGTRSPLWARHSRRLPP